MSPVDVAGVLAQHQRRAQGMTSNSPDTCRCGVKIMPIGPEFDADGAHVAVEVRRDAAFAAHQAAELEPKEIDAEAYHHEWSGNSFVIGDQVIRWNRIRGKVIRIFKKSPTSRWYATIATSIGDKTYLASDLVKVGI